MAGTLFVVATPIGNLEDISARALRVLRSVPVIAAEDTRHTARLLHRFGIDTPLTSLHEHNERTKSPALIERLQKGDDVALVSDAGTPGVSDPGRELVRSAHAAGVKVEPIPGPSALIAALSASGFSADGFTFLGFPPTGTGDRRRWMERLRATASISSVAVFYEAPHRIESTLSELSRHFPSVEILVARELTKAHEDVRVGPIESFLSTPARGEYTVVLNIGRLTTAKGEPMVPEATAIVAEFGELTNSSGLTRRQAISSLSRKYAIPARQVFALLEEGRSSGG